MFASEFERDSRALLNRSVVKCFTLIELLIVVAIISILAAIAVPGKSAGEGNGHPLPFTDETYCYAPGNFYFNHGVMETSTEYTRSLFSLAGRGPDCAICFGNLCVAHPRAIKSAAYVRGVYDATNGTISAGDIFRFGGTAAFN